MALITSTDLQNALNPDGSNTGFLAANRTTNVVTNIIADSEAIVKSYCPEEYRQFFTEVCGYYLTRDATAAQVASPAFSVPTIARNCTSANVWINFNGTWRDRRVEECAESTAASTTITVSTTFEEGDTLIADIYHDGTNSPQVLKKWCIDLAVNEMVMRLPSLQISPVMRQMYADRITQTRDDLLQLSKRRLRLHEWDALVLVKENETAWGSGTGMLFPSW